VIVAASGGTLNEFISFTVLGIVAAAIYAVAASGLVVTYTTSGIFNFAHGAIGMIAAFTYWQLAVKWGWPTPIAILFVLLVLAPAFGWFLDRIIMRGLEGTSEVTKIVVSVGLLFGLIALAPIIWSPQTNRKVQPFFSGTKFAIGDAFITAHQVVIIVIAIVVAALLRLLLYKTRAGVSMRAVVDSRSLTQLNGGRPNRSSALSWALGSSLAALAGILVADQLGLEVFTLTFLVVNAYAAAIVGRLVSLPLTYLGALVLGLLQSYAVEFLPQNPEFLTDHGIDIIASLRLAIPVIMLFVVLLILPHAPLRNRGLVRSREHVRKPTFRLGLIGFAALIAAVSVLAMLLQPSDLVSWSKCLIFALLMLSLVPLTGYGGQISLAVITFAGLGGFAAAQWGGVLGLVMAMVIAGAVGALVALPALRLRGIYLALATLAFAFFMEKVVFTQQAIFGGSTRSVTRLPGLTSDRAYMIFLAVVFAVVGFGVIALRLGPFGRRLQAMKDSPAACATLGLNLTVTKLEVFFLSSAIAGLGGALLAMLQGQTSSSDFQTLNGLPIVLMAVAGGVSMVSGALLGGFFLGIFPIVSEAVPALANLLQVAPGLIGISLARNPNGAANEIGTQVREIVGRFRRSDGSPKVTEAGKVDSNGDRPRRGLLGPRAELETLGVDRPFTADDVALIDSVVDVDREVVGSGVVGH
jgi:branched-chain amino acid transport system permease protein